MKKRLIVLSLVSLGFVLARAQAHDGNGAHNKADEDIAKLTEVLRDDPENVKGLATRGFLYVQAQQEYELGLADLEKAVALKPTYEAARLGRGLARYRLGEWRGALADFDQLCSANTTVAAAWFFRGQLRHELGLDAGARSDIDHAIEITPDAHRQPFFFVGRAAVLMALGKDDEALADFTGALSRDPRNVDALVGRAMLQKKLGHTAESTRDLDTLSELAPKDYRLFSVRARIALGAGYDLQAKAYAEAALVAYRAEAGTCRSPNRRALLLLEAARLQSEAAGPWQALDVLDEAIGLAPDRPDVLRLRVKLLECAKPPARPEQVEGARKRLAEIEALRGVAAVGSTTNR